MNVTATRLAEAMRKRGWEQSDLAREIGATQGAISKIMVGKTLNSRLLPQIAAALHVSLAWLLGRTDDPATDAIQQLFSPEDMEWLNLLHALPTAHRLAVLQLARSLAMPTEDFRKIDAAPIPILQSPKLEFKGSK